MGWVREICEDLYQYEKRGSSQTWATKFRSNGEINEINCFQSHGTQSRVTLSKSRL